MFCYNVKSLMISFQIVGMARKCTITSAGRTERPNATGGGTALTERTSREFSNASPSIWQRSLDRRPRSGARPPNGGQQRGGCRKFILSVIS